MNRNDFVEMFVGGMALDPHSRVPIVVLRDADDKKHIPIWIGPSEATSIASIIRGDLLTRPLTHDLMLGAFNAVGVRVHQSVITDLRDATYYAEFTIAKGDEYFVFDARASDVIAMAIRARIPIYVAPHVVEEANVIAQLLIREQQERKARRTIIDDDINGGIIDETSGGIDKKRWKEVLERLNPDDFKFKV